MSSSMNLNSNSKVQILAMFLMGVGLLILGGAAFMLLPSLAGNASGDAGADSGYFSAAPAKVDFPAPELNLVDLQGRNVSLSDWRGRVVLVNHWATWCPPCKAEMPVLQAYYEDYKERGFTIVAIEAGEPVDEVAAYVQQQRLTFPVWPDPQQKAMRAFGEEYLPSSYVIDPDGRVVLYWNGAISRGMLEKYVTPLLEIVYGSKSYLAWQIDIHRQR